MVSLYVHIPFRASLDASAASTVADAIIQEGHRHVPRPLSDLDVGTLYIGGPRPSALPTASLRSLVGGLRDHAGTAAFEEVSLEVAPADATPAMLRELREIGVTRLSVSAASGRDVQWRAVDRARDAGFDAVSVDLVFGGADSPLSRWKHTLYQAVDRALPHITLHEAESPSADDEASADCFAFAMGFLRAKGYEQYELTHFARPGARSTYQEHVYAHGDVLGLGPGAESFWWPDRTAASTARRWSNVSDATTYVTRVREGASPVAHHEAFDWEALALEYILLRLRTSEGLDLAVLEDHYRCPLRDRRGDTLDRLLTNGLIHDDPARVRLTPRGRLLADAVTQRLIRKQ